MKNWYVYMIKSEIDDSIYTGITNDLDKRLKKHNSGTGSKYTRSRKPFILFKYFKVDSKSDALKLESKIKNMTRSQKLLLEIV